MKIILLVVVLITAVYGRPRGLTSSHSALASVPKLERNFNSFNYRNEIGEYLYNVETSDGQKRYESRLLINPGTKDEEAVVKGYYSYPGEDGKEILVAYKSDKNGYQAEGEHLPNSANAIKPPKGSPPSLLPQVGIPVAGTGLIITLAGGGLGR